MKTRKIKGTNSREGWLRARRMGITGTDIAALAGESAYKSPLSVYIDKTTDVTGQDNEAMRIGTYMEDPIAKLWNKHNPEFTMRKIPGLLQHQTYDWVLGSIDRHIVSPQEGVLEVKCVGPHQMKRWGNDADPLVPVEYHMQAMWYLIVTGLEVCHVAALLGGTKFVTRLVEYDKEMAEAMLEIGHNFWSRHVLTGIPPEIDGSDATANALSIAFMNPQKVRLEIPEMMPYLSLYDEAKARMEIAKAEVEKAKNGIKMLMKDRCDEAICGEYHPTWKVQTRTIVDSERLKKELPEVFAQYSKQSTSRPLLIKD